MPSQDDFEAEQQRQHDERRWKPNRYLQAFASGFCWCLGGALAAYLFLGAIILTDLHR